MEIDYQPSVEPESLPGRAYPRLPDEVSPQAYGSGIGQGIEAGADVANQIHQRVVQQAQQTQLAAAHNQLQSASLALTHDQQTGALTRQGQDAFNLAGQYLPKFDQAVSQISDGIADQKVKLAFMQGVAPQLRNQFSEQLDSHEITQHAAFADKTDENTVKMAIQAGAMNYNHPDILAANHDTIGMTIAQTGDRKGWSPDMVKEATQEALGQFHTSVLDSMISDGKTDMAKHYLEATRPEMDPQRYMQLNKIIDEKDKAAKIDSATATIVSAYSQGTSHGETALAGLAKSDLDDKTKAEVVRQVESQREALLYQRSQQYDKQLTSLHTALASGTAPSDAQAQIDTLYEHGALSQAQHISMLDGLDRANSKEDKDEQYRAIGTDALASGAKLDPQSDDHKKAANVIFGDMTKNLEMGSPGYTNAAVTVASKLGIVPPDVVSMTRAYLSGGNPDQRAMSAQLLERMRVANPTAYQFAVKDEETKAAAHTINSMVSSGTDPLTAANIQAENAKLGTTDRESLDKRWTTQNNFKPGVDHLATDAKAITAAFKSDPSFEGSVPKPPDAMAAEFNDLAHQYFYHTGGNLQQAQALAMSDLKGTWGVSAVNGQRELTKYAPEHMYPGLTPDLIREDIAKSLGFDTAKASPEHAPSFAGKGGASLSPTTEKTDSSISVGGGADQVRLVESPETAISQGKSWGLAKKDEFGAWDTMRGKDNMPIRYQLPDAPKPKPPENTPDDLEKVREAQTARKEIAQRAEMREDKAP